jgi:hypothetical protein
MSRRPALARLFADLNRRYWRSRLPRYRVIRRARLGREDRLGECDNRTGTILLRKDLDPERLRLVLLHEMCHIGAGPGHSHGPRFLRKVRRLVRLGESGLLEDVGAYDGTLERRAIAALEAAGKRVPEVPGRIMLHDDIENLAYEFPRKRWATVARVLAEKYRTTPAALRRAAPWAERAWRQTSADVRYHQRAHKALEEGRMPPRPPSVAAPRPPRKHR